MPPAPETRKRSGVSVSRIVSRRHQYDNSEVKQKEFYAASKKHKAYQRLLKREGLAPTPKISTQTNSSDNSASHSNIQSAAPASSNSSTSVVETKPHDEQFPVLQFPGANRKRKIEAKRDAKEREIEEQEQVKKQKVEAQAANKAARVQRVKRFATKTSRGQPVSDYLEHYY